MEEAVKEFKAFIQIASLRDTQYVEDAKRRIKKLEIPKMRISVILVKTKPEAQEILNKLDAGEDFATLVEQSSVGPAKEKGGDLGYFAPGDMMEVLDTVAVKLQTGQHSSIIETNKGFFILMRTNEAYHSNQLR